MSILMCYFNFSVLNEKIYPRVKSFKTLKNFKSKVIAFTTKLSQSFFEYIIADNLKVR